MLRSNPTPTFSHTSPSIYIPSYEVPDTWDCLTIISKFPNTVPTHPFDILPCLAPNVGVTATGDIQCHCLPSQQFDDAVIYVLTSHSFRLPYPQFHLVYIEILYVRRVFRPPTSVFSLGTEVSTPLHYLASLFSLCT